MSSFFAALCEVFMVEDRTCHCLICYQVIALSLANFWAEVTLRESETIR